MKIAIIGTGNVGITLGKGWAAKGHEVIFGTRDPQSEKIKNLLAEIGKNSCADSPAEAAAAAEIIVIATPWNATEGVIKSLGDLSGKTIVDATNPIGPNFSVATGEANSGAELIAQWANGGRVVKAFNSTGYNNMADPLYDDKSTTMFIAGDNTQAKAQVTQLAEDLGFDVADVGGLSMAGHVESMAFVWIHLALVQGMGREIAFKLMKR